MSSFSGLPYETGVVPNVETTRDALDRSRIPAQYLATGLDEPLPLRWRGWQWRWWHFTWPILVMLVAVRVAVPMLASVRWGAFFGELGGSLRTTLVILVLTVSPWLIQWGIRLWRWMRSSLQSTIPWWLLPAVALVLAPTPLSSIGLLALAFLFTARLCTEALTHTIGWLRAKARATDRSEDEILDLWRQPNLRGPLRGTWRALRRPAATPGAVPSSEVAERKNYNRGFYLLPLLLVVGAALIALSSSFVRGGVLAVLAIFLSLAVYAWLNLDQYRRTHQLTWRYVRTSLRHARDSWVNYNWDEEKRLGAWESPVARSLERCDRTVFPFRFFAAAVLLTVSYFPLVPFVVGDSYLDRTQLAYAATMGEKTAKQVDKELVPTVYEGLRARGINPDLELSNKVLEDARKGVRDAAIETWTISHRTSQEGWGKLSLLSVYYDAANWHVGLLAVLLGVFASILLPGLLFETALVALVGRAVLHHTRRWELVRETIGKTGETEWDQIQAAAARDAADLKRDHVLLGRRVETGEQRWVHRETIHHHVHIAGSTGAGKTGRVLTPFIHQLTDGESSVLVFDLKGDQALFEQARLSAERANLSFRWFTTEPNKSTFAFNPLNQSHLRSFPGLSLATIYTSALGLDYGPGYGKSHFSEQHLSLLFTLLTEAKTPIRSFRDLDVEFRQRMDSEAVRSGRRSKRPSERIFRTPKQQEHAMDLESKVRRLSSLDAFNVRPGVTFEGLASKKLDSLNCHAIDMADVVRFPQVLYFHLPSTLSSTVDREVGRLALFSLLTAAQVTHPAERRRTYVLIDEFQELVTSDLRKFFDQARNKRIAIVAANQSDSQLDSADRFVRRSISDNVALRIDFTANDVQTRRDLIDSSGEALFTLHSTSVSSSESSGPNGPSYTHGQTETLNQQIGPRYRANDIAAMSAEDGRCQVWEKQNRGQGQYRGLPDHVDAYFHITKVEFEERDRTPWPGEYDHPGAFIPTGAVPEATQLDDEHQEEPPAPEQQKLPFVPPESKETPKRRSIAEKLKDTLPPDRIEP
ncbi:MAG: type IV secretion system DNA-binding domain-containing protein [Myxococcales bacterium]|nr:type IV secretion system DNA-binding domain-containing protein [Myxococcales bacterium]